MFLEEMFVENLLEGRYDSFVFKCIFVVGAPGSGKNYLINQFGLMNKGMKMVDIDEAMMRLKTLKSGKNIDYDYATPIINKRVNLWARNYLGLIINTTGRLSDRIINLNKQLQENYYDTAMIYVDVEESIAKHRTTLRPITSTNISDKNRQVDDDYFISAYQDVKNNLSLYRMLFDKNFILINNSLNYDSIETRYQIDNARKKLNKFLFSPLNDQAKTIISGAKPAKNQEISRMYARNHKQDSNNHI